MNLRLIRKWAEGDATLGEFIVDGVWECYTLEDLIRTGPKVPGKTAIPAGRYQVIVTMSNRFKTELPLLCNVPGFDGIRIHAGNTAEDTEGCILVGRTKGPHRIGESRLALDHFLPELQSALAIGEPCWIEIENAIKEPAHAKATTDSRFKF